MVQGMQGEASGKDVCGLRFSCAESDREAKCEDLSSLTAVALSNHCRNLRGLLTSCLSGKHTIAFKRSAHVSHDHQQHKIKASI